MTDLSKLKPGLTGYTRIHVGVEQTAPSIGSGKVPVLATPVMINVIEAAALAAVEHLLPPGHQSLGIHLDVRHFAAPTKKCEEPLFFVTPVPLSAGVETIMVDPPNRWR